MAMITTEGGGGGPCYPEWKVEINFIIGAVIKKKRKENKRKKL